MTFFGRLFGKRSEESDGSDGIEVYLDYLNTLRKPAIALTGAEGESDSLSRIGGLPVLPKDMDWPEWKGAPLAFLCQLDLAQIPDEADRNGLPASGILYFFYQQEQETWGFDPKDKGSWRVLYTNRPSRELSPRPAPPSLQSDYVYGEKPVVFRCIQTYPDCQDERVETLGLNEKQEDQYYEVCTKVFGGAPLHHLLGHPAPVQGNDMDLECQLVSNGLYCGDSSGYSCAEAKELEAGRSEWVLLFQFDTDDDTGMMWGDCGMLYFWIRMDDLKEARFENCWMILQCS